MDYRKITGESVKDEKKRSVGLMDKIKLNELEYKSPLYSAPISLRNQRKFPFAQSSYSIGQTMLITLQSASFYLDPYNSYLTFDVELTGGTNGDKFGFGRGSALNLIKSVVVTSRSGTELSRVDGVNFYRAKVDRYTKSQDWFSSDGNNAGYHTGDSVDGEHLTIGANTDHTGADNPTGEARDRFCIPLPMVSPLFAPENSRYLPPFLCSGLRVEIQLAQLSEAFIKSVNTGTVTCKITNAAFMCDLVKMSDKVDSVMTSLAHKGGLEVVISEWDLFSTVTSSEKNTIDINKTASKADKVIVAVRDSTHVSSLAHDGMMSKDYDIATFQSRLGSVYHPQVPIDSRPEAFQNALLLFKSMRKNEKDFSYVNRSSYHDRYAVVGTNLGRSSLLDSQCVPLNNSHSLSLSVGFTSSTSRQIDAYLVYKKVIKVFTNNCIVYE